MHRVHAAPPASLGCGQAGLVPTASRPTDASPSTTQTLTSILLIPPKSWVPSPSPDTITRIWGPLSRRHIPLPAPTLAPALPQPHALPPAWKCRIRKQQTLAGSCPAPAGSVPCTARGFFPGLYRFSPPPPPGPCLCYRPPCTNRTGTERNGLWCGRRTTWCGVPPPYDPVRLTANSAADCVQTRSPASAGSSLVPRRCWGLGAAWHMLKRPVVLHDPAPRELVGGVSGPPVPPVQAPAVAVSVAAPSARPVRGSAGPAQVLFTE